MQAVGSFVIILCVLRITFGSKKMFRSSGFHGISLQQNTELIGSVSFDKLDSLLDNINFRLLTGNFWC